MPTTMAEHAAIQNARRDETAHKGREVNELAVDLDTATCAHQKAMGELDTQIEEANQAARDNADEETGFKGKLSKVRATIATLQQTQDALIARIQPPTE